jgi:hypothetical protein
MTMRWTTLCLLAAAALASTGCAATVPHVKSDTQLGRVIVYRNGIAYFERYAPPGQKELSLQVPAERVDDFLKSLTITDLKSGKALPVSYPVVDELDGFVAMRIALPKSRGGLRITYVTESPAWKPSYRVTLGEGDEATLHGWAIVDNVSGEDWSKVKVGVGSTSALSFRYDLHSVQLVERETLDSGARLALAPPTGGSPYAVATKKVRVLGQLSQSQLQQEDKTKLDEERVAAGNIVTHSRSEDAEAPDDDGAGDSSARPAREPRPQVSHSRAPRPLGGLGRKLRKTKQRIRVEGFAQRGDANPKRASLRRANLLRDKLIAEGVPEGRIDVVGTGQFNRQAVRVVQADPSDSGGVHAPPTSDAGDPHDSQPLGEAHFVSPEAMTIAAEHSAMVSVLNQKAKAQRVYFYDPVSARGSKRFAFNAIRLLNPSRYTLDPGPFTVYADGQFLGEGLSEAILPHSTAFVPYALDRSIVAETKRSTREEIERLLTIERGIVNTETQRIRSKHLVLSNRGKRDAEVYVRHAVTPGYELMRGKYRPEKLAGAYLFPVKVPAGEAVELVIEEKTPILKTVDIRTRGGVGSIELYLRSASLDPALAEQLKALIESHKKSAEVEERIALLEQQMGVYRERVDEINVQLFTLKKVPQAARLRRHLAKKMQEISDKLQQGTMTLSERKGTLMALRIELQDKLAELRLAPEPTKDAEASAQARLGNDS